MTIEETMNLVFTNGARTFQIELAEGLIEKGDALSISMAKIVMEQPLPERNYKDGDKNE